jgi:hypothetical protein
LGPREASVAVRVGGSIHVDVVAEEVGDGIVDQGRAGVIRHVLAVREVGVRIVVVGRLIG